MMVGIMGSLRIKRINTTPDSFKAKYNVEGAIHGDAAFPELDEPSSVREIILCLEKVSGIDGAGLRRLMKWIWNLEARFPQVPLVIQGCPPAVMSKLEAYRNFIPQSVEFKSPQT